MRGSSAAQMRPRRRFYNQSLPIVGTSAENLRVSDPTWIEGVKVQTFFFFSAYRRLNSRCVLLFTEFRVYPPCTPPWMIPLTSLLIWPPSEGAGRGQD